MRGFETGIEKCARIYTQDTDVRIIWGDKCATDGKGTIFLPALSDTIDPRILTRTRLNMGHEVAHVLHSDFSVVEKVIKSGGLGKKTILNSVEDIRIERLWELEYTGCQEDFREDYKHFVKSEFNERLKGPESIFSKVLNLLTIRSREKQLGFNSGLVVPDLVEKLFQNKLADLVEQVASFTTMKEVEDCTEVIYKRFKEDPPPEPEPAPEPKKCETGKSKKGESDKSDKKPKPAKSKEESEESEEEPGKPKDDSKDEPDSDGPGAGPDEADDPEPEPDKADDGPDSGEDGESPEDDGKDGEGDSGKPGDESEEEPDGDESFGTTIKKPKDELDEIKEELKKDMEEDEGDTVKTAQDSRAKEVNKFSETSKEYLVANGVVDNVFKPGINDYDTRLAKSYMDSGKKILSFMGQRLQHLFVSRQSRKVIRFLKTGPLDSYRIMEDESDLICKRKLKGRNQDAVVGFSIDKSSSMGGDSDVLTAKLSLATGYFLEQIKVPFMALGLTGPSQSGPIRTNPVDISILKDFNESIRKVMGRFVNSDMSQNSDLDGMKLLAKQIMLRPEPKKIIFVFSDGQPCSGSYTLDSKHMYSYKQYIKRLQRAGIVVFGFGIEYNVENIFGKEFSVLVNASNLAEFPRIVFQKLSKVLLE